MQITGTTLNEGSLYGLVPAGTATERAYLNAVVASKHYVDLFNCSFDIDTQQPISIELTQRSLIPSS